MSSIIAKKGAPWYKKLHNQVIIAIVIAIVLGAVWPETAIAMKPFGDAFIKLIKAIITPVIFCIIVSGIAGMGSAKRVGSVGAKAIGYFYVVSSIALVIGMVAANVLKPGHGMNVDPASIDMSAIAGYAKTAESASVIDFLMNIVPITVVDAFAKGEILQVVLIAILFGFALILLGEKAKIVKDFIDQLTKVVFSIVEMIMIVSPIGAFGAMAFTIGRFGLGSLQELGFLIIVFYLTCVAFVLIVLVPLARYTGFSVWKFCKYIWEEILLFLSISNSEALLPRLMEKLERLGVSKSVVGLVIPTGYSFNLDGSNIYFTMCIIFLAQATNVDLSIGEQITILLVTMLMSKGATGFTGAGFVVLAGTLAVLPQVPMAGLALLLGIDPFMQRGRGLTNYIANGLATIIIGAWEKEVDIKELNRRLDAGPDVDLQTTKEA